MQEKFALRKTLKKVAAVGTSLAMMGITVSGALAAGLGDYPGTLGFNNVAGQTVVVYGADADTAAAQDVLSGLPGGSTTIPGTTTSTETTTTTTGLHYGTASLGTQAVDDLFDLTSGNTAKQEMDIIDALNDTDNFGNTLENEDLAYLKDTAVSIAMHDVSNDYDFHEEIRLGTTSSTAAGNTNAIDKTITIETGLTDANNRKDDWKDNIYLRMPQNSIGYYFVFDEALASGVYVSNSTSLEPFQIDFLGETISIENTATTSTGATTTNDADTITLSVGKKTTLGSGESMTVTLAGQTYTVTLTGTTGTGSGKADVTVVGPSGTQREVISQDTSISFSSVGPRPVQVRIEDVFDEDGTANDRATVIVGTEQSGGTKGAYDARKSFDNGNKYIGEDDDNPIWTWHLAALNASVPVLGIRNSIKMTDDDEDENPLVKHPLYVGDYFCLPNYYACMIFEKMRESDDNFRWYEVSADSTKSLRSVDNQATADQSDLSVIKLTAKGTDDQGIVAGNTKTEELYIAINASMVGVWRREQDGSDALPVRLNNSGGVNALTLNDFATLDYGSTSLGLDLLWDGSPGMAAGGLLIVDDPTNATVPFNFSQSVPGWYATNLTSSAYVGLMNDGDFAVYLTNSSGTAFTYLGHSDGDTIQANDLVYRDGTALVDISSYEENTRTKLGTIIHDPDSDAASDVLKFAIPSDYLDYDAVVRFARPKAGFLSTTGIGGKAASFGGVVATSSVLVKDTEVGDVSRYNAVVVGGPCVNKVAASLLGVTFPACGTQSGLVAGQATLTLKDNGAKKALLVYGWEAADTARAAVLLKDPAKLKEKLSAAGKATADSVSVKGTSMDVAAITVE